MYGEEDYALHIKVLKMILDYRLILEKFQRVIGFNQEAWLNIYVDMNAEIRKKTRNHFEREFFNLINNVEFEKPLKNLRNHRNIKLVTTDKKKKKEKRWCQSLTTIKQNAFQKNFYQSKSTKQ